MNAWIQEIRSLVMSGRKFLVYPDNIKNMFATSNLEKFTPAVDDAFRIAAEIRPEAIVAVLKGMKARPSRVHVMEAGKVPGLWIFGSMDNFIQTDAVLEKVKKPENLQVEVLAGSGHLGFIEEPSRSQEIITTFIKTL